MRARKTWRVVPGFSRYEINGHGDVRRIGRYKSLATHLSDSGYKRVRIISDEGSCLNVRVHILVLRTFVGPRPSPAHEGAHGLGGRLDNRVTNLSWKTRAENEADKRLIGTLPKGGVLPVVTDDVVAKVREFGSAGHSISRIAKAFGLSRRAVARYVRGERRRHKWKRAHTRTTC